jgi:hypothetical protein
MPHSFTERLNLPAEQAGFLGVDSWPYLQNTPEYEKLSDSKSAGKIYDH